MAPAHPDLADHFESFAGWCEGTEPLYSRLARGIATDPDLLAIAAAAPEGRSPPHLMFGGVHFLLLRGREGAIADYYPSVADDPRPPDEGLLPASGRSSPTTRLGSGRSSPSVAPRRTPSGGAPPCTRHSPISSTNSRRHRP